MQENETSFQSSGGCLCGISISCLFGCAAASVLCLVVSAAGIRTAGSIHPASVVAASAITVSRLTIFFFIRSPPCFPSSEALMRLAYNVTGYFVKRR